MKLIIAGYGYVGKAVTEGFKKHELVIIDPKYFDDIINEHFDADGIIICVTRPQEKTVLLFQTFQMCWTKFQCICQF